MSTINKIEVSGVTYDIEDSTARSQSGLTDEAKQALLACFQNVAWISASGQTYYDALETALYPPANVVGISAVYTQSGIVSAGDSLDSLKSDLVVTAEYDDGSSNSISDYTLSGTLTTGTQTITVSAYGYTDTFTVIVSRAGIWYSLPSETTFTSSDYIMTGIHPFEEDVDFTLFAEFTNSGSNSMYSVGTNADPQGAMRGGGKATGFTAIYINDNVYKANAVVTKLALKHVKNSDQYTYYFSKTGTTVNATFTSYPKELKIGGYYSNRTDLAFTGTVSRFIVYREALSDSDIATLWDGGTV